MPRRWWNALTQQAEGRRAHEHFSGRSVAPLPFVLFYIHPFMVFCIGFIFPPGINRVQSSQWKLLIRFERTGGRGRQRELQIAEVKCSTLLFFNTHYYDPTGQLNQTWTRWIRVSQTSVLFRFWSTCFSLNLFLFSWSFVDSELLHSVFVLTKTCIQIYLSSIIKNETDMTDVPRNWDSREGLKYRWLRLSCMKFNGSVIAKWW